MHIDRLDRLDLLVIVSGLVAFFVFFSFIELLLSDTLIKKKANSLLGVAVATFVSILILAGILYVILLTKDKLFVEFKPFALAFFGYAGILAEHAYHLYITLVKLRKEIRTNNT